MVDGRTESEKSNPSNSGKTGRVREAQFKKDYQKHLKGVSEGGTCLIEDTNNEVSP